MAEREVSEGHYEMLWDCEFCGTKALLAKSQRHCAECGGAQNADKRYFPKEGEARRVDGHRYDGADLQCPACSTPQGAKAKNCTQCGSALDGSQQVRGVAAAVAPVKKRRWWIVWVVLAVIVALGFGIWYRFIRTRSAQMTITAHYWERSIGVEVYGELREDDWRERVPSDARGVTCFRKERSKKKVPTGEEDCRTERKDNKDGTFEQVKKCKPIYRDEPVHDDWCNYRVWRWKPLDPVRVSGSDLNPAWPTAGLPPATATETNGATRQGARTEKLILVIDQERCEVSETTWRKYANGQQAKVEVRASSGAVVCSSL